MRTLLLIFILVLSFGLAKTQDLPSFEFDDDNVPWPGLGSIPVFAMDGQGNLYLAFRDQDENYQTTVRKYEDEQWGPVGPTHISDSFYDPTLAVSPDGTAYVANGIEGAFVSRFNGTSWEAAGTSDQNVFAEAVAIAADGTPYAAGRDNDQEGKVTVLKLVGDTWQIVGNRGFTEVQIREIELVIAPDGTPYITGTVNNTTYQSIVMTLRSNTWETVGQSAILEGAGYLQLTIASDSTPYLAYSDSLNDYKATVVRFEDSEWQPVGDQDFSDGRAVPDIAVDQEGTPYVVYSDSTLGRRLIVKRFTGTTWETVGNAGFSDFNAGGPSILISPSGTPYVAYADMFNLVDDYAYRVRVAQLEGDTWQSVGSGDLISGVHTIASLAAGSDGTLYMAYNYDYWFDPSFEDWQKTKVVQWKDGTLTDVGDIDYFKGIDRIRIAVAPDQTLYMAYVDSATEYKTSVFKLVGDSWEAMGSPFDSNSYFEFDIGSTGTPYLTLQTNVYTFDGSNWVPVSAEGFSEDLVYAHTAVDKEGTLYVVYTDENTPSIATMKTLTDAGWEELSGDFNADGGIYPILLSTDENNNLYVAFAENNDNTYSYKVMKLEDDSWETIETDITGFNLNKTVMDPQGTFFVSIKDEEKETSVITFNDSGQETIVDNDLLKGHFPYLEVDKMGSLYMVFDLDNVVVYKYGQGCTNPTNGGSIAGNQSYCDDFDPKPITSSSAPTGHTGTLEYKWQKSTTGSSSGFTDIAHNAQTYDPGQITQTTWFRRLARVSCMSSWAEAAESNVVVMRVNAQPEIVCPQDETVTTDPGVAYARKTYRAVAEDVADTVVVYLVNGKAITFPYDFPLGITTVEVKANNECATEPACSFKVTVSQATGIEDLNANSPTVQVYPNPFSVAMAVEIANPSLKEVSVEIFSMSGQKIRTLAMAQKGAKISLSWNGTNEQGKQMPEGMYLLKVNEHTRKVMKK